MPLLNKRPFVKNESPTHLSPKDEVFYCDVTSEVFTDYDEYWERLVLCNAMVWTCGLTGRPNLTYTEAIECEAKARKCLSNFPMPLSKPLLYLATLTKRGRLVDMADDVFLYARDRYFIDEEVEAIIGKHWYDCKVTQVIYPTQEEIEKYEKEMADTDDEDEEKKGDDEEKKDDDSDIIEIKEIKKDVEDDDIQIIEPENNTETKKKVKPEKISETKKKEKEKEKEKKTPEDDYPPFATFKYEVIEIEAIDDKECKRHIVSWEQIRRNKGILTREKCKLYLKQAVQLAQTGFWSIKEAATKKYNLGESKFTDFFIGDPPKFVESKAKKMPPSALSPNGKKKEEKRQKKEERAENEKELKKQGRGRPTMSREEKEAQKKLILEAKVDLKEQMEKKREEWRLKIEQDKMDKKREREVTKEEKRIIHLFMKEWMKPKEDIDCEDHKNLPTPTPIQCRIPHQYFGEFMMILEFTNIFTELLELNDVYPQGITFDMLEHALVEKEVAGVLNDIFQLFLQTIFCLQEEEDDEVEADNEVDEEMGDSKDMTKVEAVKLANRAATWSQQYQGVPLQKAPLDALTLTEILRLHLLASGATNVANAKWRLLNRGGFKNWDDPGLLFKLEEPDILKALATQTLFDLTMEQKLKILNVLVGQILTYASVRDILEENIERMKEAKNQIRQHKWEGLRKEKEEVAARIQEKRDKHQKEREKLLKEMEKRAAEAGGVVVNGDISKEKEEPEEEMEEEEDEDEKAERLEREEKRKERAKSEHLKKETELIKHMLEMASGINITSLGQDRAYRRYWIFGNMPGLFIEDNEPNPGICRDTPTPYNPNLNPAESPEFLKQIRMQAELCIRKQELKEKELKEKEKENNSDKENDGNDSPNKQTTPKSPGGKKLLQTVNQNQNNSDQVKKEDAEQKIEATAEPEFKLDFSILENLKPEVNGPRPEIFGLCNADAKTCPVHSQSDKNHWSFIHKLEDFNSLIDSLNPRGIRESELRENLIAYRGYIDSLLKNCPVFKLDPSQEPEVDPNVRKSTRKETKKEDANLNFPSGTPMNEILQLTLRDMILETEEKLELGMLGSLKVENREDWRQAMTDGKYNSGVEEWNWGGRSRLKQLMSEFGLEEEGEEKEMEESESTDQLVNDLCHAILQLGQAVDAKYLQEPLAETDKIIKKREKAERKLKKWIEKKDKKDDDEEAEEEEEGEEEDEEDEDDDDEDEEARVSDNALRTPMERWEKSLMACTNLSQLCLHFSTLENSITWSRSALEARCRVCKRKSDPDNMLLCDSCDKGNHLYCLKPKLKKVPEGEWFCDKCQPKRKPRSPVKKARRATFVEEEESEDDDDDSDEEEEEDEESVDEDDATCEVCDEVGEVICCDTCPRVYHQDCAELRKIPRGSWSCPACRLDPKGAKGKENAQRKKNKGKDNSKKKKVAKKVNKRKSRSDDDTPTPTAAKKLKMDDVDVDVASAEVSPPRRNRRSLVDEDMVLNTGALEALLTELYKREDSWPFLAPVSRKAAPDYYDIIKKPMDLGTMRHKLDCFKYTTDEEFIADGMLVFQNCQQYNQENTDEYRCGTDMMKFYLKTIKELGLRHKKDSRAKKRSKK